MESACSRVPLSVSMGLSLQVFKLTQFTVCRQQQRHACRDHHQQHAKPNAAADFFRETPVERRSEHGEPNERNRRPHAKRHTQCRLRNRCRLQLQIASGFFLRHAPRLYRLLCCRGNRRALCLLVFEKIIRADAERFAQLHQLIQIRHRLRTFPFGNRLPRHHQLLGKLLLRPALLLAKGRYFF